MPKLGFDAHPCISRRLRGGGFGSGHNGGYKSTICTCTLRNTVTFVSHPDSPLSLFSPRLCARSPLSDAERRPFVLTSSLLLRPVHLDDHFRSQSRHQHLSQQQQLCPRSPAPLPVCSYCFLEVHKLNELVIVITQPRLRSPASVHTPRASVSRLRLSPLLAPSEPSPAQAARRRLSSRSTVTAARHLSPRSRTQVTRTCLPGSLRRRSLP